MRDFRKLAVWEKAYELARAIYSATTSFPGDERFGMTSQIRRAAVSIAANLAEGCGRDSDGDMKRFAQIAMGSACELECELLLARDLNLLSPASATDLVNRLVEVKRMLSALIVTIRRTS